MEINTASSNHINGVISGLKSAEDRLVEHSQSINRHLIEHNRISATKALTPDYSSLETLSKTPTKSLEESLVNIHLSKSTVLSLMKVLEVDKMLFEDTLGRIFDTKV